jgi:hypothetical protein
MSKQEKPEVRIEKLPMMPELDDKPEDPNLVAGADMSVMAFDVLRWLERRRKAKKGARAFSDK